MANNQNTQVRKERSPPKYVIMHLYPKINPLLVEGYVLQQRKISISPHERTRSLLVTSHLQITLVHIETLLWRGL